MCGTERDLNQCMEIRAALFFIWKHRCVSACVLMEAYQLEDIKPPQVHILKSIIKTAQMDVEVDFG